MNFFIVKKKFRCTATCIEPFRDTPSGMVWVKRGEVYQTSMPATYLHEGLVKVLSLADVLKRLQKDPTLLDNVKEMV